MHWLAHHCEVHHRQLAVKCAGVLRLTSAQALRDRETVMLERTLSSHPLQTDDARKTGKVDRRRLLGSPP